MRGRLLIAVAILLAGCHHRQDPGMAAAAKVHVMAELEAEFHSLHGRYGTLEELKRIAGDRWRPSHPPEYRFEVTAKRDSFEIRAVPRDPGTRRSFYVDETLVIRQSHGPEIANRESEILK